MQGKEDRSGVRLDKWLWAARFFKTRSLAADEIGKGRVSVNGQAAKASRELRVAAREQAAQSRRLMPEPAAAIAHGRPTKRDQRQLADWNRWSASIEPE
jgi:ribosome-associated heat shock protein Hsp15